MNINPLQIGLKIQSEWLQGVISLEANHGEAQYTLPVRMRHSLLPPSSAVIEISWQTDNLERGLVWLSPFEAGRSANPIRNSI